MMLPNCWMCKYVQHINKGLIDCVCVWGCACVCSQSRGKKVDFYF